MRAVWRRVPARTLRHYVQPRTQSTLSQAAGIRQSQNPKANQESHGLKHTSPNFKTRRAQKAASTSTPNVAAGFESFPLEHTRTLEGRRDLNGPVNFQLAWGGNDEFRIGISSDRAPEWTLLYPTTLRDMCTCAMCRDTSSGQKKFRTTHIPLDISVRDIKQGEEGLVFTFGNDVKGYEDQNHETLIPWVYVNEWLDPKNAMPTPLFDAGDKYPWTSEELDKSIRRFDYDDYMADAETRWNAIIDLRELGITIIKNVPRDENAVVDITTRIANIKETLYGRTFDVRAKPGAENVAYTSEYLDLHQDLMYLQIPPKIQVLHCMDNSCEGGESLFSDGYRAGRLLWQLRDRPGVSHLAKTKVPYSYGKFGHQYRMLRKVLNSSPLEPGEFSNLWWSPPFQGHVKVPSWDYRGWIKGARILEQLVSDPAAMWTYKLQEGECVLFDNVRVLHGRKAFTPESGGSRWLRGAYIAPDDFASKSSQVPKELLGEYEAGRFTDVRSLRRGFALPWEDGAPEREKLESMVQRTKKSPRS